MTTSDSEQTGDASPVTLDKIPVHVTFDLGERRLTLAELKALQPGQVLDLGRPLTAPVNVRANGALVGRGELVEIDGALGVAIVELMERQA
jgi:type III secretion protein Q